MVCSIKKQKLKLFIHAVCAFFSYLKKLIDNSQMNEESMKMLQFVCWENPQSSSMVLTEILWHIMYTYCQELKFYLDLLFVILSIEDSWQVLRIQNAMNGNGKYNEMSIKKMFNNTFNTKLNKKK